MATSEVGVAYVRLIPSMDGFAAKARRGLSTGLSRPAKEAGRKAGDAMSTGIVSSFRDAARRIPDQFDGVGDRIKSKLSGIGSVIGTGIGIGIGAGLADQVVGGFGEALNLEAANDQLAASLGLSPEESAELGAIAGRVYADAYGDSIGQVNDVVASLQRTVSDNVSLGDLESLAGVALSMEGAFQGAATEYVALAGQLKNQGVVRSVSEGLDFITKGFQQLPPEIRGDLTEAVREYGTFLDSIGFSTEETFGVLTQAARGGSFELDKTGDALKEFQIRATDMSTASTVAFDTIGLDAGQMANRILAGGDTSRAAFKEIVDGLLSIEDPAAQANTAIALFGTPLEDLGVDQIPTFLANLDSMGAGFEDAAGAAAKLDADLNDNLRTKLEAFRRGALQRLATFLSRVVIPIIERVAGVVSATLGPAFTAIGAGVSKAFGIIRDAFGFFQGDADAAQRFMEGQAEAGGSSFFQLFTQVGRAASNFFEVLREIGTAIGGLFSGESGEGFASFARGIADALVPVVSGIADFAAGLRGLGLEDGGNEALNQIGQTVRRLAGVFINEVIPAVTRFAGTVIAIAREVIPQVLPVLTQVGSIIADVAELIIAVVSRVAQVAGAIWSRWGDEITTVARVVWNLIVGIVRGGLDILQGLIRTVTAVINGDWSAAWDGIKQILSGAWTIIKALLRAGWEALKGIFRLGVGALKLVWRGLWDGLKASARLALNLIFGSVSGGISRLVGAFRALPRRIKSAIATLAGIIVAPFKRAFDEVKGLFDSTVGKLQSFSPGNIVSKISDSIPFFHGGGVFRAPFGSGGEGPAILQDGESIFTRDQTRALGRGIGTGGGTAGVTVMVNANGAHPALTEWLRDTVEIEGGGNVQVAFGSAA